MCECLNCRILEKQYVSFAVFTSLTTLYMSILAHLKHLFPVLFFLCTMWSLVRHFAWTFTNFYGKERWKVSVTVLKQIYFSSLFSSSVTSVHVWWAIHSPNLSMTILWWDGKFLQPVPEERLVGAVDHTHWYLFFNMRVAYSSSWHSQWGQTVCLSPYMARTIFYRGTF